MLQRKELRLICPAHHNSGYAKVGRAILSSMLYAGYDVRLEEVELDKIVSRRAGTIEESYVPKYAYMPRIPLHNEEIAKAMQTTVSDYAPTLIVKPPYAFSEHDSCYGKRIGLTMLESDGIPPLWEQSLQNVDTVCVPCKWNRDTIERYNPALNVRTLPLPSDERIYTPHGDIAIIRNRPKFLLLCVFAATTRKHWEMMLHCVTEVLRGEDAGIVLKPYYWGESVGSLAQMARDCGLWVEVMTEFIDDLQMAALYRSVDCYIGIGAEGFGMPQIEAGLCGVPSISLDAGGSAEYINSKNGYKVGAQNEYATGYYPSIYKTDFLRPTANPQSINTAIQDAYCDFLYSNDKIWKIKSENARRDALLLSSRDSFAKRLETIVEETQQKKLYTVKPTALRRKNRYPLTFIITTHNNLETTKLCVTSIRNYYDKSIPILFADDASTDGTYTYAMENGIRVVNCQGGNVSRNRQSAIDTLTEFDSKFSDYICFLDNDVEIQVNFVLDMLSLMESHPKIGILAPRKVYKEDGTVQNIGNKINAAAGTSFYTAELPLNHVHFVESACMLIRPEVYRKAKWDEQFPIFYEDTDYCFQCRELGYNVCATNTVTVIHDAHKTSSKRTDEIERNRFRFLRKWKHRL